MERMYWIEEVTASNMDTALILHRTVAHAQKGKTAIKRRKSVITHWEDMHTGIPIICEVEGGIVIG